MKERPILFNDEMVRAILDGRKTQTRRMVNPQPSDEPEVIDPYNGDFNHFTGWKGMKMCNGEIGNIKNTCHWKPPFGVPGDRLWVRETFLPAPPIDGSDAWRNNDLSDYQWNQDGGPLSSVPAAFRSPEHCIYRAGWGGHDLVWRPSIHMPRRASRITLEITGVRVERLRDISEEDAKAEGVAATFMGSMGCFDGDEFAHTIAFKELWESINAPGSWAANPWVWVVEFKKEETKCPE